MVVLDSNSSSSSNNSNMETDTTTTTEETPAKNRPTQRPSTALKILNKGPGYIRERMMRRNAG